MVGYSPKDPTTITTLDELKDFVSDELGFISQAMGEGELLLPLTPLARAPDKPREGMIIYADGTNFDPGSGKGTYEYDGTAWVRQHSASHVYVNIVDYGGVGDGVADNAAALSAAFAALGTRGGVIYFPQGKYKFNLAQTLTLPPSDAIFDLTLLGDGADASVLVWGGTNGLTVSYQDTSTAVNNQSTHFRDLSFTTTSTGGAGNGLTLTQTGAGSGAANSALTELTRVAFRGDSGYGGSDFWGNNLTINAICNVNINDSIFFGPGAIAGTGVSIDGIDSNRFQIVLNMMATTINNCNIGVNVGDFVQGISLTSCNITDNNVGINVPGPTTGDVQLIITGCQIGITTGVAHTGVNVVSAFNAVMLSNTLFVMGASGFGISLSQSFNFTIVGCQFQGVAGTETAISIPSTLAGTMGLIADCLFTTLGTGINLGASASNVSIGVNQFVGVTNKLISAAAGGNNNFAVWDGISKGGTPSHIVRNVNGVAGDAVIDMGVGPAGTADITSAFLQFFDPTLATNYGKIRRNGAGVAFDGLVLPVSQITGAWSAYTPTVTGSTGGAPTVSLSSCQFVQIGKVVHYRVDITITAVSTATGTTKFTLPVAGAGVGYIGVGREAVNSGAMLQGVMTSGTEAIILKYDNSLMLTVNDRYVINGTYQAA